jgi:hypothetical protein
LDRGNEESTTLHWPYTKRTDGRIAITLDNNVWNFLHDRNIDLAIELPRERFAIFITREVEIETLAIPATTKAALKEFIVRTIGDCEITTTWVFGFDSGAGQGPQRYGGFGQGAWQSRTEAEFYDAIRRQYLTNRGPKKSLLNGNEGDAAVGAQSFSSIALTCESPAKAGPLRYAAEHGGKILYLSDFAASGQTLREYIEAFYQRI